MTRRNTWIYIFSIIFLGIVLFLLRHFFVKSIIERNNSQLKQSIIEYIENEYRLDGSKPFIMYPTKLDSLGNFKLTETQIDSMQEYITNFLLKPYKDFNDSILEQTDFVPFIKYPQEKDSLGNYQFTPDDMEMIKGYIEFLSEKVDSTIAECKKEISNDIERLNMWVSIWIGLLSFLGIFIPIILNLSATKDIDNKIGKSEKISEDAKRKALETESIVKDVGLKTDNIDKNVEKIELRTDELSKLIEEAGGKISNYDEKYIIIDEQIAKIDKESEEAKKMSEESSQASNNALKNVSSIEEKINKVEAILWQINALSKIKSLDFHRIAITSNLTINKFLKNRFVSIKVAFEKCNKHKITSANALFKDSLEEFILSFHQFPRYLEKREIMTLVDELKIAISELLISDEYSEILYIKVINLIQALIDLLDKEK